MDLWQDATYSFCNFLRNPAFMVGGIVTHALGGGAYSAFFFQAEDGIRDLTVTGVQTCALPISPAIGSGDPVARCRGSVGSLHDRRQAQACDLFRSWKQHRRDRRRVRGKADPEQDRKSVV